MATIPKSLGPYEVRSLPVHEPEVYPRKLPKVDSVARDLQGLSLQNRSVTITGQKMPVSQIRFTQATVAPYFSNGTKVTDLAGQLARGEISASTIPCIRVVWHQGQVWTLDNRRLRAFKDGLIDSIDVIVVNLKDPTIAKEFWDKKSSKSLEGGAIRNESGPNFDQGIYVFNKCVLNWTFEQIAQSMPYNKKIPLCNSYASLEVYYKSFENLIFEEARAILQAGIEQAESKQKHPFSFSLIKLKIAKKAENPTEMKFRFLPESERDVKAGDILLLEHAQVRLIALANYSPLGDHSLELSFKVVVSQDLILSFHSAFKEDQTWKAKPLGSLITLQRMYEACTTFAQRERTLLEASILSGKPHYPDFFFKDISSSEQKALSATLNTSQREAVEGFLQLKEGLYLIQGPPGTGKTTTVVQLLGVLQQRKEKILVCAPSNKAVHILAERFMNEYPFVPIILVGVEQKLPSDSPLNHVFIDSWYSQQIDRLAKMKELLGKIQPHKLLEGGFFERIGQACRDLEQLNNDFSTFIDDVEKYHLSCLKELQFSEFIKNLCDYYEFIDSLGFAHEQEAILYYAQLSDLKMPEWVKRARSDLCALLSILSSLEGKLSEAEINGLLEAELLGHSQIVFATLSVSGQQRFKQLNSVETLIVDEAGQAVEAETLIPMRFNPKKCLLIGDIQQLPATVISQDAEKLKFGRSLMERAIQDCDYPFLMLKTQYRMHPEISRFPSRKYYQDELKDHESVCTPQHVIKGVNFPFLAPYAFINIDGKEAKGPSGHSFLNSAEVKSTASIVNYLAQKCLIKVEERVAIISFYAAQVSCIYDALKAKYPKIKVNTVDGFQGGENDIVIISCVRANREKQIGFLKQSKRLNVALTRARFSLIILGHQPTLARSDIAELVADAGKRKVLFQAEILQQLESKPSKEPVSQQMVRSNLKTQLCRYYMSSNGCHMGDQCSFAHGQAELLPAAEEKSPLFQKKKLQKLESKPSKEPVSQQMVRSNLKTQLCRHYMSSNTCHMGDRCNFAHGQAELRAASKSSNSWRSSPK